MLSYFSVYKSEIFLFVPFLHVEYCSIIYEDIFLVILNMFVKDTHLSNKTMQRRERNVKSKDVYDTSALNSLRPFLFC